MPENILPIVVIGGGFSGSLTAIHLSRRLPSVPVILLEESGEAGPGLAYQGSDPSCLLNVPAGQMSAFPAEPSHFLRYAKKVLGEGVLAEDFLPRRIYGTYLQECLREAQGKNPLLQVIGKRVIDVNGGEDGVSAKVIFHDHTSIKASAVVLASGNQGSAFSGSVWASHTKSPREPNAVAEVEKGDDVLIIGSGLTMIDAVLDLDRRGAVGTIHAISRNGLLPQPYEPTEALDLPDLDHLPDSNLRKSIRLFRNAIREREAKGGTWRDVFAAVRSSTPSLWQELSAKDRSKFLRLVSPFWEIHRHQCPRETRDRIDALIAAGRLVLHRGTIVSVVKGEKKLKMGLAARSRKEATRWLEVDHIFDATGPARDLDSAKHPLIQNLLRRGFLKSDAHRLGADVSPDYRAVGRDNKPSAWLYVVGPMLRARFYEATAVHELRLHAAALASRLEATLRSRFDIDKENNEDEEVLILS